MIEPRPLSDETKAEIDAIGVADLVVGLRTAGPSPALPTVAAGIRAAVETHFSGQTTVLIHVDQEPAGETPQQLAQPPGDLRVIHVRPPRARPSAEGEPEWSEAVHTVLRLGRMLQARAIVMLSAEAAGTTPGWLRSLAEPVLKDSYGLILPVYQRNRYDGTLTHTLIVPFVQALFGRQLCHPLADEFACSAEAADFLLTQDFWDTDLGRHGLDVLLPVAAIAHDLAIGQAVLGPRTVSPQARPAPLGRTVGRVAGTLFGLAERFEAAWLDERGSEPVPLFGTLPEPLSGGAPVDPERLQVGFRQGVRDLLPIWERILAPENFGDVLALSEVDAAGFRFSGRLWARVVYDFLLAYRARVMYRSYLAQSLAPLYLGRAASLVLETGTRPASAVAQATARLARVFEEEKPYLVDRWR